MPPMSFAEAHCRALFSRKIDRREAGRGKALRQAVALFADLEADLAGAELRRAAPGDRLLAVPHDIAVLVHRLGEAEQTRGLCGHLRLDAFAGIDAVPAPGRDRTLLLDAERRHDGV